MAYFGVTFVVSFIILNQPLSAGSFLSVGDLRNEVGARESRVKPLTTVNMDINVQTQLSPDAASVCSCVQECQRKRYTSHRGC